MEIANLASLDRRGVMINNVPSIQYSEEVATRTEFRCFLMFFAQKLLWIETVSSVHPAEKNIWICDLDGWATIKSPTRQD